METDDEVAAAEIAPLTNVIPFPPPPGARILPRPPRPDDPPVMTADEIDWGFRGLAAPRPAAAKRPKA